MDVIQKNVSAVGAWELFPSFFQEKQTEMYEQSAVQYGFIIMCSTVKHIYFQISCIDIPHV